MSERRVSTRILSFVLVLCMVFGMVPAGALRVSAAGTTGNPDVTSNADTILQYAQGKLDDNHDKTGGFTWDTEGKSDGWRYFNGVMLEAFLQNGLKANDTETAYSFAQNYFSHYINESGNSYTAVLNGEYSDAEKELDGVPPARNLAQLVGHVGFTDTKYANAVKVLYNNTIGQDEVSGTDGNFIHKEDDDAWENWQVGLDGIYMAQPFLMEVAKAVKEGRVNVGDTYTEIADDVYARLNWVATNMKYQTSDGVYLYHHGWGPGDNYKNGNGVTWARGTGWWVAGLADCIALMEDIGYNSANITILKGHLKEAIDGLLKYQHSSGLWYNVIGVKDADTANENNYLEVSGTGLFAYTIMKAYTRGWLTDKSYGEAALKAIDGIMGNSTYYSTTKGFQQIIKSSGVYDDGTTYNKRDKSENEAKGVGAIIMAASMYDDVKAMVDGGSKYTETFQIGAVNVTELPVMDGVVFGNGLKATVVGSKGTIKDVTDLSATELSTELDGSKVKVLYNGNLIATVDAKVISSDATSGTGSFTVADSTATKPEGTNTTASQDVAIEITTGGTTKYYNADTIAEGNYVFLRGSSDTAYLAFTGKSSTISSWGGNATDGYTTNTIDVWTVKSTGDGYYYIISGDGKYLATTTDSYDMVLLGSAAETAKFSFTSVDTSGGFNVIAKTAGKGDRVNVNVQSSGNSVKLESSAQKIVIREQVSAGGEAGTYTYNVTLTAGQTGALLNKGSDETLTATVTATLDGATKSASGYTITWDSSNDNVATVNSSGKVTAAGTGDATITATIAAGSAIVIDGNAGTVANAMVVEIPVTVTEAAKYDVTLTLTPGSLVGKVGETGSFTPAVVIKDASGNDVTANFEVAYNGTIADTSIATLANDGTITYAKAGYTTFTQTATVNGTTVNATGDILVQAEEAEHIHSYTAREEIVTAATCGATGSKKVYCSCGEYQEKTISATGAHNYVNGVCSVCSASDPGYVAPGIENIVAGDNATGKASVAANSTLQLTANTVGGATVSWRSSDDAIATVSASGLVTGKTPGTVTITATVTNAVTRASNSATFEVTVTETVTVDGNVQTTVTTGGTGTNNGGYIDSSLPATDFFTFSNVGYKSGVSMTYDGVTTDGTLKMQSSTSITFDSTSVGAGTLLMVFDSSSADKSIKIDGTTYTLSETDGLCVLSVPLTAGSHTVTRNSGESYLGYISYNTEGTSGGTTTETKYNATLTVDPSSLSMTVGGDTVTLAPSVSAVLAADKTTAATVDQSSYTVTWTSNNTDVVTVDGSGKVTAVGAGETTITGVIAKDSAMKVNDVNGTVLENITVSIPVTVAEAAPVTVTGGTLSKNEVSVANGGEVDLSGITLTLNLSNGTTKTVANGDLTFNPTAGDINTNVAAATEVPVTVTYTDEEYGYTYTGTVNVKVGAPITVQSVALNPSSVKVNVGADSVDTSSVKMVLTMSDGSTQTIENSALTFDAGDLAAVDTNTAGTYYVTITDASGNTAELEVVVAEASTEEGFELDTSGNLDMNDGEYIIVAKSGDKYYALKAGTSTPVEVTVTNGMVDITYANAADLIWIFNKTYIYNDANSNYLRNDGAPSKGGTGDKNGTVTVVDAATGAYGINLENSGRYLYFDGDEFTRADSSDGVQTVYLYKWNGTKVLTPSSATVSPSTVNVANSGTIDMSGVTMEVTMSDGSKKTIQNADLNYDVSGINTALAGTYTVPVSYTEGNKTVTANVTVVVAAASSGGGTATSEEWIHNFSEDGKEDEHEFFTISGNLTTSYSGTYGDLSFDTALKIESSTNVTFTAPTEGTLTLVFDSGSKNKDIKINGTSYTIGSDGTLTVDVEAGEVSITKDDSVYLFYMEYASTLVDGITVTAPGTMYIAAVNGSLNPTHEMQYVVRHKDENVTSGYTIVWDTLDHNVATINQNGVLTALNPGTTSVTAKVTMEEDDTEYNATVLVTVVGPGISTTEEMTLIKGEDTMDSGEIASTVYAGGVTTTTYELGYISSDENVATVDEDGNVTAVNPGTATIYTYIKSVNGVTVYTGNGIDPQPAYIDSTAVTVSNKEITNVTLSSYDYIVQVNDEGDMDALLNVLVYESSVVGFVTAEEGVKLTIDYNTGNSDVITFNSPWTETATGSKIYQSNGLTIDLSGVDITKGDTYYAPITYTDAQNNVVFQDTLWIHVENFDPNDYNGTLIYEGGVHYILHTGAFTEEDADKEYVIVAENANIAVRNPSETSTGSTTAGTAVVVKANGQIESVTNPGSTLYGGASVDYLTMSDSDAYMSEWLLDTFVDTNTTDNVVQLNMSNFNRYLGYASSQTQLVHDATRNVQLVTLNEETGECQIILGSNRRGDPYYLGYVNGNWTATTTESSVYLYYKDVELDQDYSLDFDLYDKNFDIDKYPTEQASENLTEIVDGEYINVVEIPDGFVYDAITPVIVWNKNNIVNPDNGDFYTIVWSSSNTRVATVDQNGVVTAISEGEAIITATLYNVNGDTVICSIHHTEHISMTAKVVVTDSTPVPVLTPNEMTIGVGTMPNFNKVSVRMTFKGTNGEYDYDVPFDQLVFKLADAKNSSGEVGFDNTVIDTYEVPVTYAGDTFTLTIHVVEDPYAGLDNAESIPGYPDAGSVRMQKFATGVLDFSSTGVTKIELAAAGISTKSSVDVVLIVDVSNSMGWSMEWFNGLSDDEVEDATDSLKIPANGADGTDKLDIAMQTAVEFADILLNVPGGDNTLSFVTFAGADRNHGGSSDDVDSVRTPMVAISDYDIAAEVFANTKFTSLTKNGTGAKYTLQIGGYDDDGYGQAQVSGNNRGNTNYDYAFGEAMDAIAQIKAKYAALNNGASYDESGRQIHVVFMTDGAPSHFNGQRGNGTADDTLWDGSGDTYSTLSNNSEDNWLAYIKNYNELATQLHDMVDGAYTVGFDLAHGGFGDYSYELDDMQRVLEGLAKNTIVPATLAENEQELNDYFTSLARALAYAGTNAKVTDEIGEKFSLFTGPSMYSLDITSGGIMSEETLEAMQAMSFPITVYSYRLVVSSDIGTTLSVINADGSVETVTVDESHLGLRVNEEPDILEQITFNADGTEAYSDVKGADVNIMTTTDGVRVIDASTFTYTATLDTMTIDGVEVTHAAEESIVWKIGNISEREVSMQYYAYLDGSLDNPREAVSGVYATNDHAYLEYVDVNGDYVNREFRVPQVAWGKANVNVRFYLVNQNGEFVNRAGVTFTNPANRLFLEGNARYEAELNNSVEFDAQDALMKAGLAANNILYGESTHIIVTNSTASTAEGVGVNCSSTTASQKNLIMHTDTSGGYYSNVIIDIPVVLQDLGESLSPLKPASVVIDYGKYIDFNVYTAEELNYLDGYMNVRTPDTDGTKYWYKMSIEGFMPYNDSIDQKDYIPDSSVLDTYSTSNGTYEVSSVTIKINGQDKTIDAVRFTPTAMLSTVDRVFVVLKFQEYRNNDGTIGQATDQFYYMVKQVNVIPATSVYYETDFANGVFTLEGNWSTKYSGAQKDGPQSFAAIGADDCYGYDASYANDNGYSNYASAFAAGTALKNGKYTTTATFSFTGTGFDIISKTGTNDGAIVVTITQDGTDFTKKITVINKGENDLYQIPVISVEDLTYGTYNVEIGVAPAVNYPDALKDFNRGGDFYFDAVRIYNPAQGNTEAEAAYVNDNEANTQLFEIRDLLVNPRDTSIKVEGVSFIDKASGEATLDDYAAIGPNNELYIDGESAIAFAITWTGSAPTSIDIGAKSIISGETANLTAYISGSSTQRGDVVRNVSISSATAQFYQLVNKNNAADFSAINTAYVFIENTGSGVLSLTDIKVAFGAPSATASIDFTVDQNVLDFANACATFGPADEDTSTEATTAAVTQKGRTLSYEDMIYVIDIFELKDVEGIDLSKDAGLMVWSVEEYEALNGTLVFDEAHANAGLLPYEGEEGFYYGTSDGIFTRDLHKEAYYAGYVKLEDGSYIFSEAKLYSPAIYAYNMLAKTETSESTRNLCVALLNYISAAQKYFHGTADAELVNADLTAEQKVLEWNNPEMNLASEIPADKDVARDSKVFTGRGKNLLFEEMISLVSVYKIDDAIVDEAAECGTIFWTAEQFAALEGIPGVDNIGDGIKVGMSRYQSNAGEWASCAPAVAPKDMAETEYFILCYVIHADGTVSYSGVMSYTFEQYIHNMADSAAMGEFAMRLYYYERAAQAALG